MKSADIRRQFLDFFESRGHTVVPSSPLVPANDPTLLFTNAGMVQFKDVFTGLDKRPYRRATTSQRCLRAGGKHNDLENVGYTARHHTLFEMLGNFSFGDYFKEDAIKYAWELLTEGFKLPKDKLWVTVYAEDDEAYTIWSEQVGVPKERIIRIGDNLGERYASDNFWQMGDTGPCGPCTEIFYDHGPEVWGGPPGSPDEDGDRYIEIWNLVFMQFNRDEAGVLHPLPNPAVDTGMGLERIAAVLQGVHSNYEIDLFQTLIRAAARETGTTDLDNNSLKVIADHIRACSFMVVDGIIPGNEGRGYVLRRIIRRALRHGYRLGQTQPFFHRLVADLAQEMGEHYPELLKQQERIAHVLLQEEQRFQQTLANGMDILQRALAELQAGDQLDGQVAFTLYDTYGFPLDLTADICREHEITVDEVAFDEAMAKQREMARASGKFKAKHTLAYEGENTVFEGYSSSESTSRVVALYVDGTAVEEVSEGQEAVVVLDQTPFYAEAGGQIGDAGLLITPTGHFEVMDTQRILPKVSGHFGVMALGGLKVGDEVTARIDEEQRRKTMRNHSVTHIMHKALRQVLGDHVQQKGSLVDADKTRFDFSHDAPMTPEQIAQVEAIVNQEILDNTPVAAAMMSFDEAVSKGAMALFGEKYEDEVRVLDIGTSRELCGGTHVARTGDIGLFKIISEGGIAAGIRRVEAITGSNAMAWVQQMDRDVHEAAALLKAKPSDLVERLRTQQEHIRSLERDLTQLKAKLASAASADLSAEAQEIKGVKVLVKQVEAAEPKALRGMIDELKNKLQTGIIVLATVNDNKVSVAAGVTANLTDRIKAGELVAMVCTQVGGKGGGRPDMAMGGGTDVAALPEALNQVQPWLEQRL